MSVTTDLSQLKLLGTLTRITAHRVLKRKSTIVLTLVGLLPVLQALLWIATAMGQVHPNLRPFGFFLQLVSTYFAFLFVPLLAIFLGLGVISDEVETRNITYTITRPLSPLVIATGRFLGHYLIAAAVLCVCVILNFAAGMVFQLEDIVRKFPGLINCLFFLSGGLLAYMAVIAALGTTWRRFAILGSVVWIMFDNVFALLPVANLNAISVKYRMLASSWESLPQGMMTLAAIEQSPAIVNALVFVLLASAAVSYMTWYLKQFEFVLSGSDSG